MNLPVPQSEADKYIAGLYLAQKLAETGEIYHGLKSLWADTQSSFMEARKKFDNRIQPLQTNLNRAKMNSGQSRTFQPAPSMHGNHHMNNDIMLINTKRLYHQIARQLHTCGGFKDNCLMDKASHAYKSSDIAELFNIWEQTQNLQPEKSQPDDLDRGSEDVFLERLRRLFYLQISIDVIEDKILKMKENPLIKAYSEGEEAFEKIIRIAEGKIKEEISRLSNP